MAKKVSVKLDTEGGMAAFLRGREVAGMVRSSADRIASAAGKGFEADTWISPSRGTSKKGNSYPPRVIGGVTATTWGAARRNSKDNTLLRARDAGGV